jgi:enoyl-CoA hydratase
MYAGIATDIGLRDEREFIIAALAAGELSGNLMSEITGGHVVRSETERRGPPPLSEHRVEIDRHFSAGSVGEIVESLDTDGSDWARDTAKTIRAKSPTSLKVAFRQIREGAKLEFDDCMRMEYRMVNRIVAGHDFYEGVRATIIDKDGAPKWSPSDLAGVGDADVETYFAPLGNKELKL